MSAMPMEDVRGAVLYPRVGVPKILALEAQATGPNASHPLPHPSSDLSFHSLPLRHSPIVSSGALALPPVSSGGGNQVGTRDPVVKAGGGGGGGEEGRDKGEVVWVSGLLEEPRPRGEVEVEGVVGGMVGLLGQGRAKIAMTDAPHQVGVVCVYVTHVCV